jgi:hypothetical protein
MILSPNRKESTDKCIGQPLKKDVEQAAYEYRQISKKVHMKIKKVVPSHNVIKSFQMNKVREQFEGIVNNYKDKFTADTGQGANLKVLDNENDSDDDLIALVGTHATEKKLE